MTEERRLEIEEEERARREISARIDAEQGTAFNSRTAAVISIFIPGGGHAYKGQPFNGLAWFVVVVCGYFALIAPGVILHLLCVYTATLPTRPQPIAKAAGYLVLAAVVIGLLGAAVGSLRTVQHKPAVQAADTP